MTLAPRDGRRRGIDPDGTTAPVTYQWRSSSNGGATWTNIAGATSATFTPSGASVGVLLQVAATYSDPFGSYTLNSPETAPVGDANLNQFTGTAGRDFIVGLGGSDTVHGFVGADTVDGGEGSDTISLSATSLDLNTVDDSRIVAVENVSAANATGV